jgi:hypothetical protein
MKKILIVSFYELKDYLLYIKELFEKYNFIIKYYPLFQYAYDMNDKLDDYKEHMNEFIHRENPDIILWWFIDVPVDVFKYIKQNNKNKLFIMYNSDDPLNLTKELFDKAKIFDIIITPCNETIELYKLYSNVKTVIFGPMGFDPSLFNNKNNNPNKNEFDCDISILTYNLFLDKTYYPSQEVYKKDLIDSIVEISNDTGYKFNLYGTPILKEIYPLNYRGEVPYFKLNFLFNSSKINIITSPSKDTSLYINEYVMPIISSGGLLMHDETKDIEKVLICGTNCVLFNKDNYLEKIVDILSNYDEYHSIKNNGIILSEQFSWDAWVENLVKEIGKLLFDKKIYAELYDLDVNDDLLIYWLENGIKNYQICYDFNIPDEFNAEDYIANCNIKKNNKYAYLHWYINSKDNIYMKKTRKLNNNDGVNIDVNVCGIIMEDYYKISSIFNQINKYNTRDNGLIELDNYCKTVPYIKINEILNRYVDSIY